jgi:hypothetical protein
METIRVNVTGDTYAIDDWFKEADKAAMKHGVSMDEDTRTAKGDITMAMEILKGYFWRFEINSDGSCNGFIKDKKVFDMLPGDACSKNITYGDMEWTEFRKTVNGIDVYYSGDTRIKERELEVVA